MTVSPIARPRFLGHPTLGFDTEYESNGHKLVSFQLHNGESGHFISARSLTVDRLARECRRLLDPDVSEVTLLAYFSIAELQHLPVVEEALEVRLFGTSVDATFYSERYGLLVRTLDLARFFDRKSLDAVSQSYGLGKVKGVNRAKVTIADAKRPKFREYAIHDAYLCFAIGEKLREGFAPDEVDPLREGSPASSAAVAFRHGLDRALHPPSARVRLMGMLACWGGRAEALERGHFTRAYEYDLTSAYPKSAASFSVLPTRGHWKQVKTLQRLRECRGGVGRFRFRFPPDTQYPCLPVATNTLQIYPLVGETYCTFDEVITAIDVMGARVSIVEAHGFQKGSTALPDYMKRVISEREATNDPVRRTALKLLANSLIGKLAQRVIGPEMDAVLELARKHDVSLDGAIRLTREECEALGIPLKVKLGAAFYPEWNALITGRVRAIMGRAIHETRAIYASTDAVWTLRKRAPTNVLGGLWHFERKGPATVCRTRLAMLGEHVAHHSVWRREAGRELLEAFALDGEAQIQYTIERPIKLRESLARGEHYGRWIEEVRTADARWDNKREHVPGRTQTRPWDSARDYSEAAAAHSQARRAD